MICTVRLLVVTTRAPHARRHATHELRIDVFTEIHLFLFGVLLCVLDPPGTGWGAAAGVLLTHAQEYTPKA
jgi:hypothetical protein